MSKKLMLTLSVILSLISALGLSAPAFAQTAANQVKLYQVIARPLQIVGIAELPNGSGYWLALSNGGVIAYGDAQYYGSMAGKYLAAPVVGIVSTSDGKGYWLVAQDGGVFTFGDALFYGSAATLNPSARIVGLTPTLDYQGYWLLASNGAVYSFGDATYNLGEQPLKPGLTAVGIAGVANNKYTTGYNIANSNGSFATRLYLKGGGPGSGMQLNAPIVGIMTYPSADNLLSFWMIASDGGVFTYGSAPFCGSLGSVKLSSPVVGGTTDSSGTNYLLAQANGQVTEFDCSIS